MRFILCILILVSLANCRNQQEPEPQTMLVTGGPIITMSEAGVVEAMAIQNGRISAVGNREELQRIFPKATLYNLNGSTVLPGIVDSHTHVREMGEDRLKADLTGVMSVEEMVTRLKDFFGESQPGTWLIGQGWDEGVWGSKGYPDRQLLDEAFPNNPVALESLHGFGGFYNGKALELAGINAQTPNPQVGTLLRRPDGSPSGVMLTTAQALVNEHIPPPNLEDVKASIMKGLETMARAGVTSVHEAGMGPLHVRAFQELADNNRLPIRVYGMLNGNDEALMNSWFERGIQIDPNCFFTVRSIKVFYDGSLGSRTALLKEPYSDKPHEANMTERMASSAVRVLAEKAARHKFQMAVHAIGDEGNNRILNIYEDVLAQHPQFDHRWRIEHAQVVLPDYYQRAAQLAVISSMQPAHAVGDSKWAEDRLGPDRILNAYAWRKILDAGAPLILNSDLPGEPWEPVKTLYFAVTRQNEEGQPVGGWYKEQSLDTATALKTMTHSGAFAAFQDGEIGSLSPGALADFIELDRNPLLIEKEQLKDLQVLKTWVGGRLIDVPSN